LLLCFLSFFLLFHVPSPLPYSFPTRRSSDLLHVDDLPKHSPDHSTTSFHSHHSHFWPFHTLFAFVKNLLGSYASLFVAKSFSGRSEEHTSELQSRFHLVCRLLLAKKK